MTKIILYSAVFFFLLFSLFLVIYFVFLNKRNKNNYPIKDYQNQSGNSFIKKDDLRKLSLKERIELSWKFLYEITELIITKFSDEDKSMLNDLGHVLLENGMRYEHVVDFGIKQNQISISANIEQTQSQQQGNSGLSK